MISKCFTWGVILAIGLQLGGCYTEYGPVTFEPEPAAATVALRLQAGDQLKIIIYGEDALSGIYDISPSGIISMPLIGSIKAAGRTKSEVERIITRAYSSGKFLQEPKVTISVVSFRPFYVLGEVAKPGQYPFTSGLDVLTAIATANGFTYRASRSTVLIRHAGEEVWQQYSLGSPVPVAPGDLIRVPERYF